MIRKLVLGLSVMTFLAMPVAAIAGAKKVVIPTGKERERQYWLAVKGCQKNLVPMRQPNLEVTMAEQVGGAGTTSSFPT